ncbi:hypothetical protein DWW96_10890 [Eubacterium sp. AF17-7]|uniref:hypothetical protein n=1 Tax=Eubacterium sp. AF17-7 TaxID=2293105 RepID=UPI000E524A95|nr:hypothetical protein [Eubacterium sp. AF17-7]RGG63440.1 hypothetical protein DWW96_10890 [Eubacterium sp. AF17-7]
MRLIAADNLRDFMVEHAERIQYAIEHKDGEILESLINQIPIAYDVDKVVEQLGKKQNNKGFGGTIQEIFYDLGLEDAIEIVKGGEVNE